MLDTYDKIIRLFDTVDRNIMRVAGDAPAQEVAEARAALEQGRRDFQALRAMALARPAPAWTGGGAAGVGREGPVSVAPRDLYWPPTPS